MKQKMVEYLGSKEQISVLNWQKKWFSIKNSLCLIIISLLVISCAPKEKNESRVNALPYYEDPTFTPHWLSSESDALNEFHKIPPFQLTNQNGETITDKTFEDKIFVVDFFFTTCPGICPKMTANMGTLQEAMLSNDEVLLLSHSVMPRYDSVAVLKNYAEAKGVIDGKWHLATGERDHIYDLGRYHYFVEEDLGLEKDPDDFLHTENFVLIDKNKHIRGIYNGLNKTAIQQLIKDINTLLREG